MKKKLGIVLKGGGTRCSSYLGALQALKDCKIQIDSFVGISAGALVSMAYSSNSDINYLLAEISKLSNKDFFTLASVIHGHIWSVDEYTKVFNRILPNVNIQDLKIPVFIEMHCVETKTNEIWSKGNILKLIPQSMAYPGLLPKVKLDNKYYRDGDFGISVGATFLKANSYADVVLTLDAGKSPFNQKNESSDLSIDELGLPYSRINFRHAKEHYDNGYKIISENIEDVKNLLS